MMTQQELLDTFIEVKLPTESSFLKIKETLTRIGIASRKEKKLWQSAHILHKQSHYYIVHFKSMFALDGKESTLSETDIARTNTIASLLAEWGLLTLINPEQVKEPRAPMNQIKVLSFKEKADWQLIPKYSIGRQRPPPRDHGDDDNDAEIVPITS